MKPLKVAVLIFFAFYTVVQAAGKNFSEKFEYFPVFSWSLFTYVRNDVTSIAIEITRIGDDRFSPPRNYYSLPQLSQHAARRTSSPYKAAYGLLDVRNDQGEFERRLSVFNETFFNIAEDIEFQIVAEKFDPVEKWKSGKVNKRWVVLDNLRRDSE